jgi:hypothetical protein
MTGKRRLDGDLRRLKVAGLAYHDPIGVLAQERPQGSRKRQTDTVVHRHLHDAFQVVFDGLLCGNQLRIDCVDLPQAGIQRGCFSGAGWSGRDKDPVRPLDHFEQKIVNVIRHPERFEVEIDDAAIKHSQHQALSELGW